MIESAANCLKHGGRCPLHLPRKSPRTQRYLHSTFWSHGASEINLPAWWIMLLRSPQREEPHWASRRLAAARKILSCVAESGFLGFLYPPRTLAIVQQILSRDKARLDNRQGIRCASITSRTFSSIASDPKNGTGDAEHATARAGSLPSVDVGEPISKLGLEYYSDRMDIDSRLAELFNSPGNRPDHEKAWQFYQNLQHLSEELTPQQLQHMIQYLNTEPTSFSSERVISLVEKIPFSERDEFHHTSAIRAALNQDSLEIAMDFHRRSLRQMMYPGGASLILRYAIELKEWKKAIETLDDYFYEHCRRKKVDMDYRTIWEDIDRSSIWRDVRRLPFTFLLARAGAAAEYATQMATQTATPARWFALEVITEAFSIQIGEISNMDTHYSLFNMARNMGNGLETQMSLLYNRAIYQLLIYDVKKHEKIAVEYYRQVKTEKWVPEGKLLDLLLNLFCAAADSTGIYEVIDDFRRHYREIPISKMRRLIKTFSKLGEAEPVYELLREYVERGGKHPEFTFNSLLAVHHRRAEPHLVVKCFYDLQRDYGFVPNVDSWNWVIGTHTRTGDLEGAKTWFDRMVEAGSQPDARTYQSLMQMYARRGDIEAVHRLFRESENAGVKPDLGMIESLVLVLIKYDRFDDARKVVEDALHMDSDHPRTTMWNHLIRTYAKRGDLIQVREIHKRMHEVGVPADTETYAALIRCLTHRRMPRSANKILYYILPRAGIEANALHWELVMSGFFERKSYNRVLMLYKDMLRGKISPTQGTQNILLKTVAALERQNDDGAQQPRELARTLAVFKQSLVNMNPAELAPKRLRLFVGKERINEAFISVNFSRLMSIYGREAAFDKVRELYEQYLATAMKFQGTIDFIPPIELLTALLAANAEAREYAEVDRCWQFVMEKANQIAAPSDLVEGKPWQALYTARFILNVPLTIYMLCLETQDRIDQITALIESLVGLGFEFNSVTWNAYVQILSRNEREKLAFTVCERELLEEWYGWESLGHTKNLQRKFALIKPDSVRPTKRFPAYETMVYLAGAYMKARLKDTNIAKELAQIAPKAMNAVGSMPQIDDEYQDRILGNAENIW